MKTTALALSALALAAGLAVSAPEVQAQTAARVESQTRPNFGLLLDPPASRARPQRQPRRWNYGSHRPDWRSGYQPPYGPIGGAEEIVLVDCGGNPGTGAVEDAVRRVRPGGTLVIRARAGACVGWLNVDKPMTIIGEGGFDPRRWNETTAAALQAPDGMPCITVSQGVRLELRDIVLSSPRGGDAACIVNYGGQIVANRFAIRHVGDEAAIYADGGEVDLRDTVIDARTIAPAIYADGATLTTWETVVTGAQSGIEILTGGSGQASRIDSTTLTGADNAAGYGPRSIGLLVRSRRELGRVDVINTKICGYSEGVSVEGAAVNVSQSKICRADRGAVVYNGELTLTDSRVRADAVGVAVSGRATVRNNTFVGVREVFQRDYRSSLDASGNRVWSDQLCRPRWEPRYRDRYAPQWYQRPDQGYDCQFTAYPRDWWDDMDGAYGDPYNSYSYMPDNYGRFQQGYGWYDQNGRYVDDGRSRGDDRWRDRRRW